MRQLITVMMLATAFGAGAPALADEDPAEQARGSAEDFGYDDDRSAGDFDFDADVDPGEWGNGTEPRQHDVDFEQDQYGPYATEYEWETEDDWFGDWYGDADEDWELF